MGIVIERGRRIVRVRVRERGRDGGKVKGSGRGRVGAR